MTYEYLCTACGHQWEEEQSITAAPLQKCPACKKNKAQRQVSGGAGFVLKGGGWYADLYSSAKPSSNKGDGESSKSESGAKGETGAKSDTSTKTESTKKSEPKTSGSGGASAAPGKSSGASGA